MNKKERQDLAKAFEQLGKQFQVKYAGLSPETQEDLLRAEATLLEPLTHCCECTQGIHHYVHIQYEKCTCDPTKYILKNNPEELTQ